MSVEKAVTKPIMGWIQSVKRTYAVLGSRAKPSRTTTRESGAGSGVGAVVASTSGGPGDSGVGVGAAIRSALRWVATLTPR